MKDCLGKKNLSKVEEGVLDKTYICEILLEYILFFHVSFLIFKAFSS